MIPGRLRIFVSFTLFPWYNGTLVLSILSFHKIDMCLRNSILTYWYLIAQSGVQIFEEWDDSTAVPCMKANCVYLSQLSETGGGADSEHDEKISYPAERIENNFYEMESIQKRGISL